VILLISLFLHIVVLCKVFRATITQFSLYLTNRLLDMAAATDHSPFLTASTTHIDTHPVHDASEPIVHEPASDGLAVFKHPQRSMLSWFRGYTRAGCRCGQCPLGQEEPCEYALPERWVPIGCSAGCVVKRFFGLQKSGCSSRFS
jgi:hypothetical protein